MKRGPYWELLAERAGPGRAVAVANQKGGVGKTTVAVNLAAALGEAGQRVLVIDLDPQANASTGLGVRRDALEANSYHLISGEARLPECIVETVAAGVDCVPSTADLAGSEIELVGVEDRERRLGVALAELAGYDVAFIDCPPSLGLLTVNALTAATDLLVPVQCEYYALEGLGELLKTAERIRAALNRDLRITGLVLTMYDARTKLSSQVSDEVRAHFGDHVYRAVIPRSVRLSEAPSFGEPVIGLAPNSRGAIAFRLLATEFVERRNVMEASDSKAPRAVAGRSGEGGRGYGTPTPVPSTMSRAWPRPAPWLSNDAERSSSAKPTRKVATGE